MVDNRCRSNLRLASHSLIFLFKIFLVMKELLSFHFLLEDVPFKIKTMLNLAEIQVDFELNLYGSLYLLYFLVQL